MTKASCVVSSSAEHTRALGEKLATLLVAGDVIALSGDLGAGKTCLVQGIARGLGVDPRVPVTSPTYTLVAEYSARVPLRHADFYRVETSQRLDDAGFDDLLDGEGVVVVEWAERFPSALPRERLEVHIAIVAADASAARAGEGGEPPREIRFAGQGLRADEIRRKLPGA